MAVTSNTGMIRAFTLFSIQTSLPYNDINLYDRIKAV